MPANTATAAEIARALGVSRRTVERRARLERWPFRSEIARGGPRRLFLLGQLPQDTRLRLSAQRLPGAVKAHMADNALQLASDLLHAQQVLLCELMAAEPAVRDLLLPAIRHLAVRAKVFLIAAKAAGAGQ